MQLRIRQQLAAAERDGSHVAATRLLRMLGDLEEGGPSASGPPTPDEIVEQMRGMPGLWHEAGTEMREELLELVAAVCRDDPGMSAAVTRAARP